jgi:geranylgeranyl diphosphate synthase type I
VLRLKSGRYSFERPIELGAVLAGAPAATRAALARYGRALGEAFQLQDDVLGLYGDAGAVGKPVGGDLAGGKYTFLVHFALERLDGAAAASVRAALGRADLAPAEAEAAAAAIRDSGALDRVREMIDERLDQARAELAAAFDERPAADAADGRDFLAGLIDGLGSRRR